MRCIVFFELIEKKKLKILWTREALLRFQEIEKYISRDNPSVDIEFIDKLTFIKKRSTSEK